MNAPYYPSAFPICDVSQNTATGETTSHQHIEPGMTLRDYFEAKAMHQFLAGAVVPPQTDASAEFLMVAQRSYEVADAMLKARQS